MTLIDKYINHIGGSAKDALAEINYGCWADYRINRMYEWGKTRPIPRPVEHFIIKELYGVDVAND